LGEPRTRVGEELMIRNSRVMSQGLKDDRQVSRSRVKVKITFLYAVVREGLEPGSMQDQSKIRAGSEQNQSQGQSQDQSRVRAGS
jgi:hypothetical protein